MSIEAIAIGLTERDLGHLKYLHKLAMQPAQNWEGFYRTPNESMNFALRFQIAFAGYALFGLARRTPAYRAPYAAALKALIGRMTQAETWAYWLNAARHSQSSSEQTIQRSGKLQEAVDFAHSRLGLGGSISPDPCLQGNIQYSAHLASLLGFYELLTGDDYFDKEGLVLRAEAEDQLFEFRYTHTQLAEHLHAQMEESHFGGVCCEPGRAYVACNNHVCISNLLHDRLHGTQLAGANARWAEWVEKRMLTGGLKGGLPLPAPNGLLSVAYMPDLRLSIPISFNLTDAWGLAFMAAWQPDMVRQIYPRLRRRLKAGPDGQLRLGSVGPTESFEISSEALNTAFATVLAREMGDSETFKGLLAWADANFEPVETNEQGRYYAARPAPYVTALLTLAQALSAEGGGLYEMVRWQPDFSLPYLVEVSPDLDVCGAVGAEGELRISLRGRPGRAFTLRFENCPPPLRIIFAGTEISPESAAIHYKKTTQRLSLELTQFSHESSLVISL